MRQRSQTRKAREVEGGRRRSSDPKSRPDATATFSNHGSSAGKREKRFVFADRESRRKVDTLSQKKGDEPEKSMEQFLKAKIGFWKKEKKRKRTLGW